MSFVSLILLNRNENIEKIDLQFKKETWQPVTEWHTENLVFIYRRGLLGMRSSKCSETIYVVKCQKGYLGIYPSKYPQIRDINKNTKIKYLEGEKKDGLFFPERLEIQN